MNIMMNIEGLKTLTELEAFLEGTQMAVCNIPGGKQGRYDFIKRTLSRFAYSKLKKAEKGIVIAFLQRTSGYSRQQITRLIAQYQQTGKVVIGQKTTVPFARKYTKEDVLMLSKMDEWHETPSGGVMTKLLERAHDQDPTGGFEQLKMLSISHLYNLRKNSLYLRQRQTFEKTKPVRTPIGERRKPVTHGMPGYLRIDTVHQGDLDGVKGVYYINAVDEVTQFEIVVCVEKISEAYLMPALEYIIESFPFNLLGFHSDNGSEYINKTVANLLKKLHIEFTKSRPRRSGDNGLVESKNGSVIRKHFGYAHIPQRFASLMNDFARDYLNPYINYHRPCYFPQESINEKGKLIRSYPYCDMMTPFEKLKSLPGFIHFLKPGVTIEQLEAQAHALTDNQAAKNLQKQKTILFDTLTERLTSLAA